MQTKNHISTAEGPYAWHALAACANADTDLFFPKLGTAHKAKQMCARCPVRRRCLEEAMQQEAGKNRTRRYGIRGGLSPLERIELAAARAVTDQ
ncbi:WhiB family transcriptional regulator [Streptomyces sp. NBC_00306]|uniref:WhiB family transcriptional regulator n=1 Tax=Streptomyces sp. NBC_00306 TaxID=2975708 RepID=UPI002E27FF8F|nr:WhiB family transcriptional regulator [Streptomyces sp. NBC_00306]